MVIEIGRGHSPTGVTLAGMAITIVGVATCVTGDSVLALVRRPAAAEAP